MAMQQNNEKTATFGKSAKPFCLRGANLIKTHNSESRGQEETGHMRRMSELFTGSTAVKFVNALIKPPLKLSLSYQGLSMF